MSFIKKEKWTETELDALPAGEHDYFERKSGALYADKGEFLGKLAKTISALANTGGGYIILGVDNAGVPDGVPPTEGRAPIKDWLEQKIPFLVDRPLSDFRVHIVERATPTRIPTDKEVVVIDVGDSPLAPHQCVRESKDATKYLYYFRQAGHSEPAPNFYLELLRSRSRFPNPEIVRAWFYTVINPLLSELAMQHDQLHQRTWRFEQRTQSIKGVCPLTEPSLSMYTVKGNQEQFFETYPHIEEAFNKCEEAYPLFQQRVAEFYKLIRESQALVECYQICTSPESLQAVRNLTLNLTGDTSFRDLTDEELLSRFYYGPEDQFLDLLTEHIINRTGVLIDTSYTVSPFWNTHREKFLALLRATESGYCERHIKEAADALLVAGVSFANLLEETRKQLSQQHGVAYYQPTAPTPPLLY